ncbi:MAG TPA: hypothetical protein VN749_00100, partial [Candidatus Eisenbacteria bacterium]|nr:hypothetical protein [Candidatus Eisenbacteria bacterium]
NEVVLRSRDDIKSADSKATDFYITRLPLADYHLLSKFKGLRRASLGQGATDSKLAALAGIGCTNLIDLNMLDAPAVTDVGINALTNISSLRMIGMEGTSITDAACVVMATRMRLTGVNVANCDGVTKAGMRALIASETVTNLSFSADSLSRQDALELVRSLKNGSWCAFVDTQGKLDWAALNSEGKQRNITVGVTPKGTMQTWGLQKRTAPPKSAE